MRKQNLELTLVFDNDQDIADTLKLVQSMREKHSTLGGYYGPCRIRLGENVMAQDTIPTIAHEMIEDEQRLEWEEARRKREEALACSECKSSTTDGFCYRCSAKRGEFSTTIKRGRNDVHIQG